MTARATKQIIEADPARAAVQGVNQIAHQQHYVSVAQHESQADLVPPSLTCYELVQRVRKASRKPLPRRDYLAVEIMAAYLLMACDPSDLRSKCYQVADDLLRYLPDR